MSNQSLFHIESSVSRGGRPLLATVSIALKPGLNLVTGDNGSGKSSLLLALSGPEALVQKYELSPDIVAFRKRFPEGRFLAQDTRLQVIGPTLDNDVEITALLRGMLRSELQKEMNAVWDALPRFLSRRIGSVSRGELQRFVLGQAASRPPVVLALDEPDGFLDRAAIDKLVVTITRTLEGTSKPIFLLVATHRAREWEHRLKGIEWNAIALPGKSANPMAFGGRFADKSATPFEYRLPKAMKIKVGGGARRLRKTLELSGHRGTIVTGMNGSGKTSLLRAIASDRRISRSCRFVPDWSADVGDVRMVGELELDPRFSSVLHEHEIEGSRPVAYCSWGQRRMLSMFEALSMPCPYYLFDEPFAGLSRTMQWVMAELFAAKVDGGAHVLLSSNQTEDTPEQMQSFEKILINEYLG